MRDELQSEWNDMLSKGWEVVATGHQHLVDSVTTARELLAGYRRHLPEVDALLSG